MLPAPPMPEAEHLPPSDPPRLSWGWWLALGTVVLAAYAPTFGAGFIWDDQPGHVTRAELQSLDGLLRIWFEPGATQQYYPFLHSFFWLQHRLWGDAPAGYHLVNLLLHLGATALFVQLLRRLRVPGAPWAALLFAIHPVGVETVAWISEQKNTLSTVLFLAAALTYLRQRPSRGPTNYAIATGLFVLALLTKTVTATLPAVLLVIVWWRDGHIEWRREGRRLLPWFCLAALAAATTVHFERAYIGASGGAFSLSAWDRLAIATRAPWFYAGKLLWPAHLLFVYPRWEMPAPLGLTLAAGMGLISLLAGLFLLRTRARGPLAAALLFGGTLFPALGFFNVYPFLYSFVADHFQYLASLALFALAGAAVARLPSRVVVPTGLALVLPLALLSWRQTQPYRDVFSLYQHTLAGNPDCWMAHNNLAEAHAREGRYAEALPHLEHALRLRPDFPEALNNLGDTLTRLGRAREAVSPLERALVLQPRFAEARNHLGIALAALGRTDEALAAFREALRLRPRFATASFNLGLTLARAGRTAEALAEFQASARHAPGDAIAHLHVAIALTLLERLPEAMPNFERAVSLAPDSAEIHNHYARALGLAGRYEDAIHHGLRAVELNPGLADAHLNLARAYRQVGRPADSERHQREALRLGARP
ncbi:MAG: tetratricopeptide repeat protein [Verrucomicrobia bacterium]|nr:tetratricopeptide repeat protein [Verrucomicrobiota bacterium]